MIISQREVRNCLILINTGEQKDAASSPSKDRSRDSRQESEAVIKDVKGSLARIPATRSERIGEVKETVECHLYQPASEVVAEKIIGRMISDRVRF